MWQVKPASFFASLVVLCTFAPGAYADVRPHALISEGMVLQRDREVWIGGRADPRETVTVRFRGTTVSTIAENGRWSVRLKSGSAGGPFPLIISGKNLLTFKNVLVGEVWLCGGQSNMWWPYAPRPGSKELNGTENTSLRLFTVPTRLSDTPQADIAETHWHECGPKTVSTFSAVAYYFGRDLQKELNVPIGLIHASHGGSAAAQWTSATSLAELGKTNAKPVLYNGMISPLTRFAIRGVIWYQGEADTGNPVGYQKTFPALIRGWRADWQQGDFPFLFVQIAPFGKIVRQPQESGWAELRDVQRHTSLTVPQTGMAVVTDCGHESAIHPLPKEPVGERLAWLARSLVYGDRIVASGPAYSTMTLDGNKAVLTFKDVGLGLEAKTMVLENVVTDSRTGQTGGALHVRKETPSSTNVVLEGFTIAAEDRQFVNALAEIRGSQVIVWNPNVIRPIAVRYGWADYPTGNLFNKEGLPASPFRTDRFPH